ncbi:MAG: glycosyltransferase family 39 protein [Victivallales bacterium]|nr:glycosyltransferase family 39 protein [Victivallales bacterium]
MNNNIVGTEASQIASFKGFFSKWNIIILLLVICSSLWLNFRGISKGLPSEERFKLSLENKETVKKILPEIKVFRTKKKIIRSEFLDKSDRNNFIELARFSPYFDSMRSINSDEFYVLKTLSGMVMRHDINPRSYIYGPFFIYQIGASLAVAKVTGYLPKEADLNYYLLNPEQFVPFYMSGRILCAIYGTLAVLITFLIGYRLGKTPLAAFASAFLAFMPLLVLASKFIKADTPTLFWSSLVLLFSLPILERAKFRDYLLTGICIGLATGCKYPAAFTAAYPVMFHLMRKSSFFKKDNFSLKNFCTREELMLLSAGAISFLSFLIISPSFILDHTLFMKDLSWVISVSRGGSVLYNIFSTFVCLCYDSIFYTLGLPGFIAISAGIIFAIIKPQKVWLAMLPMIFLFLFLASKGMENSDAYLMPSFVPMVLLAGRALCSIKKVWLKSTFATIVLISTLSYAHAWNNSMAGENSRISALRWINANIKARSSIATLRYPVFYRVPAPNPTKYKLLSEQIDGEKALNSDYYLHSSFQWLKPPLVDYILGKSAEIAPVGFEKIIDIENMPEPYFGFLKLKRSHRLNAYFEVVAPRITLYKKQQDKNL